MNIEITNPTRDRIDKKYFQKIGKIVLRRLKQPKNTEISLVFVDDKEMEKLNRKYRGKNKATDVLSFAYGDVKIPPSPPFLKGGENLLGEIVISVPQAKKQAKSNSYPLKNELTMLFVHGILHLVGYDDETEKGYKEIMKKQEEILESLI